MPACKNATNAYYTGSEPSPRGKGWCARAEVVGKIRKGTDGNDWVVKETVRGSRRWILIKSETKTTKQPTTQKGLRIRVCEVSTSNRNSGVNLTVTQSFLEKLMAEPFKLRRASGYQNAYVFGKRYAIDTYDEAGRHENDVAQTGIILLDGKGRTDARLDDDVAWDAIAGRVDHDWNDRRFLRLAREKISPTVLFVGQTDGGDAGATVLVHRSHGHIDSLIIDNCYFLDDE